MSVRVTVPLSAPPAAGVKLTLIVQLAPAITEPPQVLVAAKWPVGVMVVMVKVAVPVFFKVTACEALLVLRI